MAKAGYRTVAIVDTPFYIRNGYGYDRGFQDFVWIRGQRAGLEHASVTRNWRDEEDRFAARTLSAAQRWVEQNHREKFFLLVDTWDPHEPWDPPSHYVRLYLDEYDGQASAFPCYWSWKEAGLSQEDVKRSHAHYCAEITMVDYWIGGLLRRVESLDLMDETVIIFTSDHGFYFGEHGLFGKARRRSESGLWDGGDESLRPRRSLVTGMATDDIRWYRSPLYDEVTRIPLLVHLPQAKAAREAALGSSADLMPTILCLAGLDVPETVHATSLTPLLEEKRDAVHDIVVTSWPFYDPGQGIRVVDDYVRELAEPLPSSITDGDWTLIYAQEGEPVELYHTAADPRQKRNVLEGNEEVAQNLHGRFFGLLHEIGVGEANLSSRRRLWR
jgi:arylsulfatase A-like enzyme